MSPCLREPFFLRGQRSWLMRAIWMSLAIGSVGLMAGAVWFAAARSTLAQLGDRVPEDLELVYFSGSAGLLLAAFSMLDSYGLRRPLSSMVLRAGWVSCMAIAAWLAALLLQPQLDEWYVFLDDSWNVPLDFLALYGLLWFAWSTASFRATRIWLLTAGLSFLSVPLTIVSLKSVEWIAQFYWSWLPGISLVDALDLASVVTFGGQFFAALLIPWGIPFWRPPAVAEMPDGTPGSHARVSAFISRDSLRT